MGETIEVRRKRLRYQSCHRGTKEIDLMLGRFTDTMLAQLTAEQLDRYETLLANPRSRYLPMDQRRRGGARRVRQRRDEDVEEL